MQFEDFEHFLSRLISELVGIPPSDELQLHILYDPNWESLESNQKSHKDQKRFLLKYGSKKLYQIDVNPYFCCCAIHNMSNYAKHLIPQDIIDKFKGKRLTTLFPLLICLKSLYQYNIASMVLTTPYGYRDVPFPMTGNYAKSYKIAKNLLSILGGYENNFRNNNTENNIAHIGIYTNKLSSIRSESVELSYGTSSLMRDCNKEQNRKSYYYILNKLKKIINPT